MDFFTCVGSIRYENSRSRFLTYLETEFAAVSGSLQVFNSVLARSVGRSVGRSLHPPSRDDRIHASLANVLQALLRELAMEWQLECGGRGRTTGRGRVSPQLPRSSPHNKTTPCSASSASLSPIHTISQHRSSVRSPLHPRSHSLSSSAGRFSRAKLRWSAIGRWRSRKHKCTLTPSFLGDALMQSRRHACTHEGER